jgi:hypothetical protein
MAGGWPTGTLGLSRVWGSQTATGSCVMTPVTHVEIGNEVRVSLYIFGYFLSPPKKKPNTLSRARARVLTHSHSLALALSLSLTCVYVYVCVCVCADEE